MNTAATASRLREPDGCQRSSLLGGQLQKLRAAHDVLQAIPFGGVTSTDLVVRRRLSADLEALVALLALTQRESGYPVDAGLVRADWLASADELGSWVAVRDDRPMAHVALHPPHGVSVPVWRAATGRPVRELAVISRLFSRTQGGGSLLLRAASEAARRLGRAPVLEVQRDSAAYAFYLRHGWALAGEVQQDWGATPVRVAALILAV